VKRFDGSTARLAVAGQATVLVTMNWRQNVLSLIARPEALFLLLLGALAGLGTEISHPGLLFPGIVGVLCLILFLFATQLVPVNWAGVLLILAAVAMFAAEVKVPAYGLLTVFGLVAMVLGAMMLVDAPIPELRVPLRVMIPAALGIAAWTFTLVSLVLHSRRLRATTGAAGLIGQSGVADEDLGPEGWVRVQGERWRAVAETLVRAGERVRVAAVDGLKLRVRKEG
jgi:membrane-bound serine protease (ClpP class)